MALIYHPKLKVTVEVPEQTVRVWRKSGWRTPPKPKARKIAEQKLDVNPAPTGGDSPREGEE